MSVLTFTVHEPPSPDADRADRADNLEFVKDGFSWPTLVFPPLGFAATSLWLWAAGYLVAVGLLAWLLQALKVSDNWIGLIIMAINAFLAFELSTLKRWDLDRKGWRMLGVVNGKSLEDCERRFLETWLPAQPVITTHATAASPPLKPASFKAGGLWPFGTGA